MLEHWQIVLVMATFAMAGVIKGITGLGLPTICLVLMTFFIDLKLAIIIVAGPALATNIWQALYGKAFFDIWKRLWSYFIFAMATVWIGTQLLLSWDQRISIILLGVITLIYSLTALAGWQMKISAKNEIWSKPVVAGVNGIITGMTGTVMMPSVAYFQAIGLQKDILVQSMGILFSLLSLTLILVFNQNDISITEHIDLVALSIICAFAGLLSGQRIRNRLPQEKFKKVLLTILLILGILLILKSAIF